MNIKINLKQLLVRFMLTLITLFILRLLISRYLTADEDSIIFRFIYIYLITSLSMALLILIFTSIFNKYRDLYGSISFISAFVFIYTPIIFIFTGINYIVPSNLLFDETLLYLGLVISLCILAYSDIIMNKFNNMYVAGSLNFRSFAYFIAIVITIIVNIVKFQFKNPDPISVISDITYQGIMTFIAIDTFIQICNNKND